MSSKTFSYFLKFFKYSLYKSCANLYNLHHWTNAAFRVTCLTLNIQCAYNFLARNNFIAQFLCINGKCIIKELSYLIKDNPIYCGILSNYKGMGLIYFLMSFGAV